MDISEENYLAHYGIIRRSGRYPWGSGGNVTTRSKSFLDYVQEMKSQGLTEVQIAKGVDMTTTQLRALRSIARNEVKQANIAFAERLKEKGYSNGAIAERMGLPGESSVRALLAPGVKERADILQSTADMLKEEVANKTYIDVGSGVEQHIGISDTKLRTAVAMLEAEGYSVQTVKIKQLGTDKDTTVKVLAPPGTTQKDVFVNREQIQLIGAGTQDNGRTWAGIKPPLAINPDRVAVKYAEDGGADADGVIYVRPGVPDVSLGKSSYAQVRIQVGKGHYLKGMAMYNPDLPDGVDLMFNTNKSDTGNKLDAMKELKKGLDGKVDADNPFGSVIKPGGQLIEKGPRGKERVTSVMNIVNEEGDWSGWSRNIASQILSKQSPKLAKEQLAIARKEKEAEFAEIMSLTNPVVKERLLRDFADSADSAAVHLKAAALPRQGTHIILPIPSLPEGKVYAPNYRDGETVVLIRYPHAGKFEIPELVVDNNHRASKKALGQARDAIGINPKVAERLSGADFDGDTVLVIPNNSKKFKTDPALEGLKNFDPRSKYPKYEGMPIMTAKQKGQEMGNVSNLITDMTIKGASPSELARAVRHSMVVIDAEKHELNYKQSAVDNGIAQLKKKYQKDSLSGRGASTLISRAKSEVRVLDREPRSMARGGPIDPSTGKKVYQETGLMRRTRSGDLVPKMIKSKKLAETDDASTLSSGTAIEQVYVNHSNGLKSLANRARKESLKTPTLKYSPSAAKAYAKEVQSLNSKLSIAVRNRPLERQAQILAGSVYKAKKQAAPDMDKATEKKVKYLALEEARRRTGAGKQRIVPTQSEWDAIQAGAISTSKLKDILSNSDLDVIKELASPRRKLLMNPTNISRAKAMLASGATRAEVADQLGVSLTTLDEGLK